MKEASFRTRSGQDMEDRLSRRREEDERDNQNSDSPG